jgi:FkbM family methyltransferase
MDHVKIRLSNGAVIAAPASLRSISTYVLLEQETWFEKEYAFVLRWLQPGMTAVDIGSNIGVYSLPMAQRVGPDGQVFSYEPASEPRRLQEIGRELNRVPNLQISAAAMSDREGEGHLVFGQSSELNSLGSAGPGEKVALVTLDREAERRGWPSPDFVKIDAEGEEERILDGGRRFFADHSPLVLFEIKAGTTINAALRSKFAAIGYDCYRALPDGTVVVRDDPRAPLDDFELNLFAAKPDRAGTLAAAGFLVDQIAAWKAEADPRTAAFAALRAKAFAQPLSAVLNFDGTHDPEYREGLAAYAEWRDEARPMSPRCGALAAAFMILQAVCRRAPSIARLSTFARCAWDWGRRHECALALRQLVEMSSRGAPPPSEPFWPAAARFDDIAPDPVQGQSWFLTAALEQLERASSHSTLFLDSSPYVAWICAQPFAAVEMERRRCLCALRQGQPLDIAPRLQTETADHLNAAIWRRDLLMAMAVQDLS